MRMPKILRRLIRLKLRHYDAAQDSRHNENHWANAAGESADALIDIALETLRNRARYEVRNNTYARGVSETLANDVVGGGGPKVQVQSENDNWNSTVEAAFADWAAGCDIGGRLDLAGFLRLAVLQLCESGEALIIKRDDNGFKLQALEPDHLQTPAELLNDDRVHQGVRVDFNGRPVGYYLADEHPGAAKITSAIDKYTLVPADQVIHLFRVDRPGQCRGVPWLSSALPLFAQLRRYTAAVLQAAETAADFSAVIESNSPDIAPVDVDSLDEFDVARNMLFTLPAGWKMNQFKPEQPASGYAEFKREVLGEIARCLHMSYNVAAADSSKHNFASGRLDWKVYYRSIEVIHHWLASIALEPIFSEWLREARNITGQLPARAIGKFTISWIWQGHEPTDPVNDADAATKLREAGLLTLAEYHGRRGRDWEADLEQLARENAKKEELGLNNAIETEENQAAESDEDPDGADEKQPAAGSDRQSLYDLADVAQ